MQGLIDRTLVTRVKEDLNIFPVVVILGPRQSGKTTLSRMIGKNYSQFIMLDLEKPSDLRRINDPELFFDHHQEDLVCLDEIQRRPDLFQILRSAVDERRRPGQFLVLGSASGGLTRQNAESLAGRVSYIELTPFTAQELGNEEIYQEKQHWIRGGFPRSYLAESDRNSLRWREQFLRTFLERDLNQLGIGIPGKNLERFLYMMAHLHGNLFNSSMIGKSLGISYHTARSYLDIFEKTYLLRVLRPFSSNMKKRLVKSPKVYVRDTGVLHTLLEIDDFDALLRHPTFGSSWEGYCLENIISALPDWKFYFFRTATGNEIDLILERGGRTIAIEFKATKSPKMNRGLRQSIEDIQTDKAWIIAPVEETYSLTRDVTVTSLTGFLNRELS